MKSVTLLGELMFDLISIGDTIVDTFVPLIDFRIFEKDGLKYIGLPLGNKVPVDPLVSLVGGNAANNVIGGARLGLRSAIYTNVGNKDEDEWDDRIIAKFKKERVDIRYIVETNKFPSDHHIVLDCKGERSILVHHYPWDYSLPDLEKTKWLYFSSVALSFAETPLVSQIEHYIERTGANLVYTPGTHQLNYGVRKFPKLLSFTKVFIVNKEEAKRVLGIEEAKKIDIEKLLKSLGDLGPKMTVITDGEEGSYGFDGEKYYKLGVFPAKLFEMTGAGDAYASGLLAGLFRGHGLPEAMRWGAANGAAVVEKIGPQDGLLTYNQIQEKLKEHSKIIAKEI